MASVPRSYAPVLSFWLLSSTYVMELLSPSAVYSGSSPTKPSVSPLLGRPLLEALGLNTRNILAAAAEKLSGAVDVSTLLGTNPEVYQDRRISRVLEGVYHADGGSDDADLDDNDGWLDLGPEDRAEKEIVLKQKLSEARAKGISAKGETSLEELFREYDDVIMLKLDGGEPADMEALRVRLKPGAIPVRATPLLAPKH